MQQKKKSIVILGGGFAGIRTALTLAKNINHMPGYEIILVDERNVHIYTPDLYEIATAYHEKITEECLVLLKDTVASSLAKIFHSKPVRVLRDKVIEIHPKEKHVILKHGEKLHFDYLVLTLGSVVNYYDIPGLQENSYPFKTLSDALGINCHLDIYFQTLWKKGTKKRIDIVVGGAGATGVELACELPLYLNKLCKKYDFPREHISITVVEASKMLAGEPGKVTACILQRFKKLGIHPMLETLISSVEPGRIHVKSKGKKSTIPMDILMWTGGVKPHPLIRANFSNVAVNGALPVNEFLQNKDFPYIFAAGDNAYFIDQKKRKPAPMLAQAAFKQAKQLAINLIAKIVRQPMKPYILRLKGIIIPLGGKYAILKSGRFVFKGRLMWVARRLVDLGYALSILPFTYAIKKWIRDTNVFVGND